MKRLLVVLAMVFTAPLVLISCSEGGTSAESSSTSASNSSVKQLRPMPVGTLTGKHADYCSHNRDPACPTGTYKGPHIAPKQNAGHRDAQGRPVHGGPVGADGSTGNNLTQEYCAKHEDPGCPVGSYVAPNAIPNPDGSHSYVKCEGTICTNPNHGGGEQAGHWSPQGAPVHGGPRGADGSSNNLPQEYCARNEDPGCPMGSYVGKNAIKSPTGDNAYVPCEGSICHNPNHGAGPAPRGGGGSGAEAEPPGEATPKTQAPTTTPAPSDGN